MTKSKDPKNSGNIIDNRFGNHVTQDSNLANIPEGKIELIATNLELRQSPARPPNRPRMENLALMRAHQPTVSYYRYLHNTVGQPYLWFSRRKMGNGQLKEIILNKNVEIYVLYVGGVPAGFVELDKRVEHDVEIAHLGLLEEFSGRGLGRYLLDWAIDHSWQPKVQRIWTTITNYDHPKAMGIFQQAGFEVHHQSRTFIDDPRFDRLRRVSD